MACKYYDITISALDIADATGNSNPSQNGVIFVDYTDCYGTQFQLSYDTPGTYLNAVCADDSIGFTFYYYKNNGLTLAGNSYESQGLECSGCYCYSIYCSVGPGSYSYTDCVTGLIENDLITNGATAYVCSSSVPTQNSGVLVIELSTLCGGCPDCLYYTVTVSQTDLNNAVGNSVYFDNTVYLTYTDCNNISQTNTYSVAGTYPSDICVKIGTTPNIFYYSSDTQNY